MIEKKQTSFIDKQLGQRVRLRRMLIGMSQERLGELLGLTFQQVQKYEKGLNRISAGRLFEVAHILGVKIQDFFEGLIPLSSADQAGFAEPATHPPVIEFMSSGEGLQLSMAFMRIKDPKVRKKMLDLIKTMTDDEETKE